MSHIEAEVKYIAVLDDIFRALEPHFAGLFGALLAAMGDEIGKGKNRPSFSIL